jgi:hypothetical protein
LSFGGEKVGAVEIEVAEGAGAEPVNRSRGARTRTVYRGVHYVANFK